MHDGYWHDGSNWWWIPMVIMMVAFWSGLAWVVVSLVRHNATHHHPTNMPAVPHHSAPPVAAVVDPRQVLAERLARGDIDVEDYKLRLDALDHGRSSR